MDLRWINGTDNVAEMATKTNVNFNALEEGVSGDIATAKTEAISETQTWAKGVFTRKNLLIDGDFQLWLDGTNFVAPSNSYTATIWKCNGTGTVTKVASGMQITGTVTVMQIMETLEYNKISGKTVTLSYSLNGVITTSTFVASSSTVVNLTVTDKIINWIKLEEGDFRTPFESKLYGDTLLSIKRYYQTINANTRNRANSITAGTLTFYFPISEMRIAPTMIMHGTEGTDYTVRTLAGAAVTGFTYAISVLTTPNQFGLNANKASHGMSDGVLAITSTNGYIVLDARL